MNLDGLEPAEIQVFADLLTQMMFADGEISFDELTELEELAVEFGDDFQRAIERSQIKSREEALAGVASVDRPEARQLILTILHDMAVADGLEEAERRLLESVRAVWG